MKKATIGLFLLCIFASTVGTGCATSKEISRVREAHTAGTTPLTGTPTFLGEKAKQGKIRATGSWEEGFAPNATKTRESGANGDLQYQRALKGGIAWGLSDKLEMGLSGRHSSTRLGNTHAQYTDRNELPSPNDLWGGGFSLRYELYKGPSLTLDALAEWELLRLHSFKRTSKSIEFCNDFDDENTCEQDPDPHLETSTRITDYATARIGLEGHYKVGQIYLIGGANAAEAPYFKGYRKQRAKIFELDVTADNYTGLESALVFSGYAGVEANLTQNLSLQAVGFAGVSLHNQSAAGSPGFRFGLTLRP